MKPSTTGHADETGAHSRAESASQALVTMMQRIVIWEWDADADCIVASANLPSVYGVSAIENVSRGFTLVHPDDYERHQSLVHTAVDRGRGYESAFRIVRPDTGATVWIHERAEAIARDARQPAELIGLAIDATPRHGAGTPPSTIDAFDAMEEFGDALLASHASALRQSPRSQRMLRGAWIATAERKFGELMSAPTAFDAKAVRCATSALRDRRD